MATTPRKPPLTVVTPATTGIQPPRQLGQHGMQFWQRVMAEFAISDVGGQEILMQACSAIDRAEMLAAVVESEGAVLRTRSGTVKSHPSIRDEMSARQVVLRAITKLGIDLEPQKTVGRPTPPFGWRGDNQ
jgi:P27 family predicted phage terminase small subunit